MIAYDKTWLANLHLQKELDNDVAKGYITITENAGIKQKYPSGLYNPNLFVRVGLFILTCIIVLFADGLIGLMFSGFLQSENFATLFFVFAAITYASLELMVSSGNHYRSGVDDALLIIFFGQLITAFALTLFRNSISPDYLTLWIISLLASFYLTVRFGHVLMGAICYISVFAVLFYIWIRVGAIGLATVPFIMMISAALLYRLTSQLQKKETLLNYHDCLIIAKVVCLLTLYAAGNYYVIQRLGAELMGTTGPVKFGWFFWAWSILLPFVYLGSGIRNKNVILLRSGMILIVAAAITFRYYYHLIPTDVALSLSGAVILALVYAVVNYLKTPKHGFTHHPTEDNHLMDQLKIESLIVAGSFSHTPTGPADQGTKFGGGDFGGGGSSGNF